MFDEDIGMDIRLFIMRVTLGLVMAARGRKPQNRKRQMIAPTSYANCERRPRASWRHEHCNKKGAPA